MTAATRSPKAPRDRVLQHDSASGRCLARSFADGTRVPLATAVGTVLNLRIGTLTNPTLQCRAGAWLRPTRLAATARAPARPSATWLGGAGTRSHRRPSGEQEMRPAGGLHPPGSWVSRARRSSAQLPSAAAPSSGVTLTAAAALNSQERAPHGNGHASASTATTASRSLTAAASHQYQVRSSGRSQ